MPDDQRLQDADRDLVEVGADFVIDPQHRVVLVGTDDEAHGHHRLIVLRLAVNMLHTGDRLDDRLQRLGYQLDRIRCLEPIRLHDDIDHRHADLRLLFAWDGQQRDQAGGKRGEQE